MHLSGQRRLRASADDVWSALFDPALLCHCIPGCQRLRRLDDEQYLAVLNVPIPLLSGAYEAKISATDQRRPERCRLTLSSDTRFGSVRASGLLRLAGDGTSTVVTFDGELELGRYTSGSGTGIAGRLLAAPARALLDRFFACLEAHLSAAHARP